MWWTSAHPNVFQVDLIDQETKHKNAFGTVLDFADLTVGGIFKMWKTPFPPGYLNYLTENFVQAPKKPSKSAFQNAPIRCIFDIANALIHANYLIQLI